MTAQDRRSHGVPCPSCGAALGRMCKRPSGHEAWAPHADRVRAAKAAGLYDANPAPRKRARDVYPPCATCGKPNSGRGEPPKCEGCFLEYARHDIALTGPGELYAPVLSYAREENDPEAFLSEADLCAIGSHPMVVDEDGDGTGTCEACGRSVPM